MELNVKAYVNKQKEIIKKEIKESGLKPKLTIIKNNNDPRSDAYVRNKIKDCEEVGIEVELTNEFKKKYTNPTICQLPYDGLTDKEAIKQANIPAELDVDGFNILSEYKPCTPMGVINYLNHLGKLSPFTNIVIIGRGELVGKPLVEFLMNNKDLYGTINVITSKTSPLVAKELIALADVIVTATGHSLKAGLLNEITPCTTIIDCGIQVVDGKLSGDIPKKYYGSFYATVGYTPVPRGVGLLTRLTLLQHVWDYYNK